MNNFYSVLDKKKKLCLISGGFNINLLNYHDNHAPTEEFVNTLSSLIMVYQFGEILIVLLLDP